MKRIKNMFFNRIVIYLSCTVLLSSSLFMSYQVPVYAEVTYEDLLRDAVDIALAAGGIYLTVQSGGTLAPLIIPYIQTLKGAGFDVYDYVTQDETAGTTTISADFVNLVLQAYKQYKEENETPKFDGTMNPAENGYYCFPDFKAVFYNSYYESGSRDYMEVREWTNICTRFPCAVLARNGYWTGITYDYQGYIIFYNKELDEFYCSWGSILYENGMRDEEIINISSQQFIDGYFFPTSNEINKTHMRVTYGDGTFNEVDHVKFDSLGMGYRVLSESPYSFSANSSSIPIYQSLAGLKQGLRSGDFSGAYNYGKKVDCETPAYTGTYDGGDITVPTEKLEGIQDKLDEIDKTDKDIYEKLKELLEWLIGNTGGAGGSVDLTTTNSWLEKIYTKLSQIFDMMQSDIQDSMNEIVKQLKKIKRWTAIDTVVDGVDAIADWLDLIRGVLKDAKEGAGAVVASLSSAVGDSVDLMAKKFPFSIPWDILFFVSALSAEPQVPHFEIPFNIELSALDITIDYTMELDFSQLQWLSDLSRLLLSMTYAVGLMKLTFGVTSVGKEE